MYLRGALASLCSYNSTQAIYFKSSHLWQSGTFGTPVHLTYSVKLFVNMRYSCNRVDYRSYFRRGHRHRHTVKKKEKKTVWIFGVTWILCPISGNECTEIMRNTLGAITMRPGSFSNNWWEERLIWKKNISSVLLCCMYLSYVVLYLHMYMVFFCCRDLLSI